MKPIKRNFIPGSEWIYIKIYSGFSCCEKLLMNEIYILTNQLSRENLIKKWFFIRFTDSDFHLRVRLQLNDIADFGRVIKIINRKFDKCIGNVIDKIQLDTYKRELERYRPYLIESCESIFYIESRTILKIIKRLENDPNTDTYRWLLGLKMINDYLDSFFPSDNEKLILLKEISEDYKLEFGNEKDNLIEMRNKYRQNKKLIANTLSGLYDGEDFKKLVVSAEISNSTVYHLREIKDKLNKRKENVFLNSIIRSLIHMMMNRLFIFKNRMYELVLYDFLYMHYSSKVSRSVKSRSII